jgi:signal transduction histidine kinase/DNA-binding response OmpR family regulator
MAATLVSGGEMSTPTPDPRKLIQVAPGLRGAMPKDAGIVYTAAANILIVDDRDDKLLVFRTVLEELNQNLVTMQSGEDALRWLLENDCAVILLDVNMPGMDGFETAHMIRARPRSAHIPIIFITGYADEMHTARGYSLGAVDYILSPVVPSILRSKVGVFVQLFNLREEASRKADEHIALAREQAARAAAEAATRRASFLAEASKILSSSLDVDSLMTRATRLLVPVLADFSAITLAEGTASSSAQGACAPECKPEVLRNAIGDDPVWTGAIEEVLATGRQKIIARHSFDIGEASTGDAQSCPPRLDRIQWTSGRLAVLPLVARGKTHGVLSLAFAASGTRFGDAEIALASDLAARVAMAMDNCLLFRKIQEADRRKDEFLATLSHELRNPLAPMRTALHSMRLSGLWPAKGRPLLEMLERQIEHMSHLVDDLLDIARITQGKIQLRKEKVDLAAKIMRVLETCRTPLEEAGHQLCVSLPRESVWVEGDRVRLQQIIENLLTNAIKYTNRGGRIEVCLGTEQGDAVIRVRDTGVGIEPEMLPKIWEMFTQATSRSDQARSGLGIGLSLVKQLVHLHAGSIAAASEGLGTGSEFTVRLPLTTAAENENARAEPARAARTEKMEASRVARRILVVDDNVDAAESLAVLLGIWGHEVQVAHDGVAALELAPKFDPELVFLDIGLPEMNGYDVARHLRQDTGLTKAKYIALSGYGTEHDQRRSREAGFDLHLVKPVDPRSLSGVIDSVFRTGP